MRILIVGAGALGGYFGGRLKEAGRAAPSSWRKPGSSLRARMAT